MKRSVIMLCHFLFLMLSVNAQVIKDKRTFVKTFLDIYKQRQNGFESLMGKTSHRKYDKETALLSFGDAVKPTIKLPFASDCYISSNHIYGATFRFPDSSKGISFYKELKSLLSQAGAVNKEDIHFKPIDKSDPYYESFYFSTSTYFTVRGHSISFSKVHTEDVVEENPKAIDDGGYEAEVEVEKPIKKKRNDTTEVHLLINPGDERGFFTKSAPHNSDMVLNKLIAQVAFSSDTTMRSIRFNQMDYNGKTYYESKLGIQGFSAGIEEEKNLSHTFTSLNLNRMYKTTKGSYADILDSMMSKMNAAIPEHYYFTANEDENGDLSVFYEPIPYHPKTTGKEPQFAIYIKKNPVQKFEYWVTLSIKRSSDNE